MRWLFNIVQLGDIGSVGNFLWTVSAFFQEYRLLIFPRNILTILPHVLRELSLSGPIWKSSLCPGSCDSNKHVRDLHMSLWLKTLLEHLLLLYLLRNKIIRIKVSSNYMVTWSYGIEDWGLHMGHPYRKRYSNKIRLPGVTTVLYNSLNWWTKNSVDKF